MRIAFVTETFLPATDGIVTRLRATIDELSLMGDDMIVIAPKYGEGPGSYAGTPIYRISSVPLTMASSVTARSGTSNRSRRDQCS